MGLTAIAACALSCYPRWRKPPSEEEIAAAQLPKRLKMSVAQIEVKLAGDDQRRHRDAERADCR